MKTRAFPNTYIILFGLIILCAAVTWLLPGGQYVTGSDGNPVFVQADSAADFGIRRFISKAGRYDKAVLALIALLFSAGGAIFGMSEETIPFVGLVVPLTISMGYNAIVGLMIVYVASNIGFSSAFLNPFTVGIAHRQSQLLLDWQYHAPLYRSHLRQTQHLYS